MSLGRFKIKPDEAAVSVFKIVQLKAGLKKNTALETSLYSLLLISMPFTPPCIQQTE
jgi:hypothetical protein